MKAKINFKTKYMGKADLNKQDLDDLVCFNIQIPELDISILKSNKFCTDNTNWNDPSDVMNICKKVMDSDKDDKEKLYILGTILTHNKNEYIKDLKKEFYKLQIKIKRQRVYINKLIDTYINLKVEYLKTKQNKYNFKNKNNNYKTEDEIAWKKANEEYNKRFNNYGSQSFEPPKKKVVIVRKKPQ